MSGPLSFRSPSALEYFATLVKDDASLSLTEAAAAVAQAEHADADVQAVLAELDRLADKLRRRLPDDLPAVQRLQRLNTYFFQELGFSGNANDYYDPANSYLHEVIATRRGIPISLAVVYIELATQIGLPAKGVSFPGHFLVKMRLQAGEQQGEVLMDPFGGRSLSRTELDELVAPYKQRQGLQGEFDAPLGLFLQAATPREIVARMLRNLKEIHRSSQDWARLLAISDRLVILLPDAADEKRDRATALAQLGRPAEAAEQLSDYLEQLPPGTDVAALKRQLRALRDAAGPRLH